MKIDEEVKFMKQGKFCMCDVTGCKYRILKDIDYIEYLKNDGTWEESGLFTNMLMADWVLLDDTLSDKVVYLHTEDAGGNISSVNIYPFYRQEDVKMLIQRIKSIQWFNDMPDDARHDIFVDIDKEAGPRFKVTK